MADPAPILPHTLLPGEGMNGMRNATWVALAVAPFWMAVTCGIGEQELEETVVAAELSSAAVVPPVESRGIGQVRARRIGNGFEVRGTFQGLESDLLEGDQAAVVVAQGGEGSNGPDAFILDVATADKRSGTFSLGVMAFPEQIEIFEQGGYYLLIRTTAHPEGELRAQLR